MNILYLSKLSGNLWAGPNNSVPKQVAAQMKYDNCFWYNLNYVKRPEWNSYCHNMCDYPSGRLKDLPEPFCRPDLVIVEELYCFPFQPILFEIILRKIPFIIVPRSTLTINAQKQKHLKKIVGNFLWFNYVIKHASAIHYLSEKEKIDSSKWKNDCFVIPNGVDKIKTERHVNNKKIINAAYIGRIDLYQKGLDMLLDAIDLVQSKLRDIAFHLSLYGPDCSDSVKYINSYISDHKISDIVSIHNSVFGEEKCAVLTKTDLFMMTSRFEGMPMGLIEALSFGIPCFVTEGTYFSDEITGYNAGWSCGNDASDIANEILVMISEINSISEKSQNALRLSQNYLWTNIAHQSHLTYLNIVGGND